MNKVKNRKYILSFDVWEPLDKVVDQEIDKVIRFAKKRLHHAANIHIGLESETEVKDQIQ